MTMVRATGGEAAGEVHAAPAHERAAPPFAPASERRDALGDRCASAGHAALRPPLFAGAFVRSRSGARAARWAEALAHPGGGSATARGGATHASLCALGGAWPLRLDARIDALRGDRSRRADALGRRASTRTRPQQRRGRRAARAAFPLSTFCAQGLLAQERGPRQPLSGGRGSATGELSVSAARR